MGKGHQRKHIIHMSAHGKAFQSAHLQCCAAEAGARGAAKIVAFHNAGGRTAAQCACDSVAGPAGWHHARDLHGPMCVLQQRLAEMKC